MHRERKTQRERARERVCVWPRERESVRKRENDRQL